ncbi:MAG: glycosyltransferase family 4 protein [Leptolyngbyaceae cyanobacterium SL_7_1]|nr:glycosyltransferase family 4 protein [Leptolyngbyaceae cyanobacterium SL_7_1]
MTRQKVCITTLEFPPDVGGVGESVYRISQMLVELGYDVHVAVFHSKHRKASGQSPERAGYRTTEQEGITVHRIRSAMRSTEDAAVQDYLCEVYTQLKALYQRYQFDLFHAFFLNETGFLTTLLGREHNVPVINSIRGSDLHKHVFNPKQHAPIAWTLENSAWTTFVSRDLQHRATVLVPTITNRSSAFWNSIVPIDFSQLPTPALKERLQGTVIGSVGRFRDKKGIDDLIEACELLPPELAFTLLLVGDFAEKEKDYWQAFVNNSRVADRVVVTGMVPRIDALSYLSYMDVFTIPSTHDGCPNALLEAMLAGRAIVGTNVDAIGEILADGVDSLVVNPGSPVELAVAIEKLARSPQRRQQLGIAARQKVLTHLAPAVEQDNWQQVYEQVLGKSTYVLGKQLAIA